MTSTHLVYVADVYCPWCYAFAPIMRRLAEQYPDFPVKVVGGNLISRPITLAEDAAQSPGLADFWHEVERTSGRSLEGAINALETGRDVRLYSPGADEILAVLKVMAPGRELEQMFELEDLFYGQGRDLFTDETLAEIAEHWGLTPDRFESALDQPGALRATEKNLAVAAELMGEITSYPSVLLIRGDKIDAVSRGFVHFETVQARMESAMRDMGVTSDNELLCSRYGNCTMGRK